MLSHFDLKAEVERMRHGRIWDRTGHSSKTIAKEPRLRVLLNVLRGGEKFHERTLEDRVTVHAVSGRLRLQVAGRSYPLPSGHLAVIEPGAEFVAEALEDSSFLLSISWSGLPVPPQAPQPPREARAPAHPFAFSPTRPWKRL